MAEIGTVIEVLPRKVKVHIPHSERCKGCHACQFIADQAKMEIIALNKCGARKGDQVKVAITASGEMPATFLLYGVPMAAFLIVLILLLNFIPELYAFLGAVAAVALSYLGVRWLSKKMDTSKYLPTAIEVISSDSESTPGSD